MTFVITSVNIGWQAGFMGSWAKTFAIVYGVGTHITYIFAPISHKWTAQMVGNQACPPGWKGHTRSFNMNLILQRKMVGGTGIEPVTPTMSR